MKKLLIGASLLALIGTGVMAQAPTKELTFAVLNNKETGAKLAEITVSVQGLHFKIEGYPTLDLSFQDVELLKKAAQVNAE